MQTVTLRPNSDVGPNQGTGASPHYLLVDDEPNDGDATFVTIGFFGFTEVYGIDVSAIPDGSTVLALRVRWVPKGGASPATGRAGLRIGGVYYYALPRTLPGSYMPPFDEPMTHPDGLPWTKERIAAAFLAMELTTIEDDAAVPRPHFSELVAQADIIPPGHAHGTGSGRAPRAGVSSQSPAAAPTGRAPRGGISAQSPKAALTGQGRTSSIQSKASRAGVSASGPRALTPADLPRLRISFASQSPRAAISSRSAQTSVTPRSPKGEES